MAGTTKQIANSELDRRSDGGNALDAVGPAVVIVKLLVVALAFVVTVVGLNAQTACTGNPVHEKLIGSENVPCGSTFTPKTAELPADTVAVRGLEDKLKSGVLTGWLTATVWLTAEVLTALLRSPL